MANQPNKPTWTTLEGPTSCLEEAPDSFQPYHFPAEIRKNMVNFADLVATLKKDPAKYFVPSAVHDSSKLRVVENRLFLKAAKEAAVERMIFNLVHEDDAQLKRVLTEFPVSLYNSSSETTNAGDIYVYINTGSPNLSYIATCARAINGVTSANSLETTLKFSVAGTADEVRNAKEGVYQLMLREGAQIRSINGIKFK